MNDNKLTKKIIIISIISIVLISIFIVGTLIILKGLNSDKHSVLVSEENKEPGIEIKVSSKEPNQDMVKLDIKAITPDTKGIKNIVLPDGKKVESDIATFEIKANGEYKVIVNANNGKSKEEVVKIENISKKNADKPYIPEGFKEVESDLDKGFVIEDKFNNQYVWIPVDVGFIQRERANDNRFKDDDSITTEFVNSVGLYKGFYIARYEAGRGTLKDGNTVALSRKDMIPWTQISYQDAFNKAQEVSTSLAYKGVKTGLISSYGWNAVLNFIDTKYNKDYRNSTENGNYSGEILKTGQNKKDILYNVADLAGNMKEWTTEKYIQEIKNKVKEKNKDTGREEEVEKITQIVNNILRGGSAGASGTPNNITVYPEGTNPDITYGFRLVLFKN